MPVRINTIALSAERNTPAMIRNVLVSLDKFKSCALDVDTSMVGHLQRIKDSGTTSKFAWFKELMDKYGKED
jgi:hypothetical protein